MSSVEVTIPHTLGKAEALSRMQRGSELLHKQNASLVRELTWQGDVARVVGKGFQGELRVADAEVHARAELAFPLNAFPLRAKRELEDWLQKSLA